MGVRFQRANSSQPIARGTRTPRKNQRAVRFQSALFSQTLERKSAIRRMHHGHKLDQQGSGFLEMRPFSSPAGTRMFLVTNVIGTQFTASPPSAVLETVAPPALRPGQETDRTGRQQ